MHLHDERGVAGNRPRVVGHARLIGGADFAKTGAARLEQLGDAEATADLQQLAAGNNDLGLFSLTEVVEDEHQRRGVVVDHRRCVGTAQNRERVFEILRTAAPGALGQAVLEGAVVGANRRDCANAVGSERRPPEIGVDEDPGSVDYRRDARRAQAPQSLANVGDHGVGLRIVSSAFEGAQMPAHSVHDDWCWKAGLAQRLQDLSTEGIARRRAVFMICLARSHGASAGPNFSMWSAIRLRTRRKRQPPARWSTLGLHATISLSWFSSSLLCDRQLNAQGGRGPPGPRTSPAAGLHWSA